MHRIKKWIYYCDYCNKNTRSASATSQHEKRCTLNPNRVCGFHKEYIDEPQHHMDELMAVFLSYNPNWNDGLEAIRSITEGCPGCILATIRLVNKITPVTGLEFDYKSAVQEVFDDYMEKMNLEAQHDVVYDLYH